jgi:hypothetical protein
LLAENITRNGRPDARLLGMKVAMSFLSDRLAGIFQLMWTRKKKRKIDWIDNEQRHRPGPIVKLPEAIKKAEPGGVIETTTMDSAFG